MKLRGIHRRIGLALASALAGLALHAQLNFGSSDTSDTEQMLRSSNGARMGSTFEAFRPLETGPHALDFDSRWAFPDSALAADAVVAPAIPTGNLDALFLADFSGDWGMNSPISSEVLSWTGAGEGGYDAKPMWIAALPAGEFHIFSNLEPLTFGWLGALMLGGLTIVRRILQRSAALSVPNFHPVIEYPLHTADPV